MLTALNATMVTNTATTLVDRIDAASQGWIGQFGSGNLARLDKGRVHSSSKNLAAAEP